MGVKRRAQALAKQIWDFCAEWDAKEPPSPNYLRSSTPEMFNKNMEMFKTYGQAMTDYDKKRRLEFGSRFSGRIESIRDQLAEYGQRSERLDMNVRFSGVGGFFPEEIARKLQSLADKIKE